ncbi:hypothetical protein [Ensifer sp. 2TAB8]|uniref:hypothetical protein n=1 Tax=Ensifer sp. 2TAB8 TaxID=3233006 RepID=UPI003F92E95D
MMSKTQLPVAGEPAVLASVASLARIHLEALNLRTDSARDPIQDAIEAYRDGLAAYNSAPGEDDETIDRTYGPPLDVLTDWEQPAQTREGAMAALRLALEEERQFKGLPLSLSMLKAALAYFESEGAAAADNGEQKNEPLAGTAEGRDA